MSELHQVSKCMQQVDAASGVFSKKWKFSRIWKKNATQIIIILPHFKMWGRKITNLSSMVDNLSNTSADYSTARFEPPR